MSGNGGAGNAGGESPAPYNVLFLSSGNAGRSLMAEAILRGEGQGRFQAFSAGMDPSGGIHTLAAEILVTKGFSIEGLQAKPVSAFLAPNAPVMDFIFTLSDDATGEVPPDWPGDPVTAHWGIEDPARVTGPQVERERAFANTFRYLRNRIRAFSALPLSTLDRMSVRHHLAAIGAGSADEARAAETSV